MTLVAVAATALLMRPGAARLAAARRFDVALPDELGFDWPDWPVVSPDGQHLVFTARLQGRRQLWMRALDGTVQPLPIPRAPPSPSGLQTAAAWRSSGES